MPPAPSVGGPFVPTGAPAGSGPLGAARPPWSTKVDASPLSQGLVFAAFAVAFAALAIRFDDPTVFVAAACALALGVAASIGVDLRRLFGAVAGGVLSIVTVLVLTVVWLAVSSRRSDLLPYPPVLLAGLLVLGADWRWVERLRPAVVVSGLGVAPLLEADLSAALVVSLIWFATTATALWSLQRDARHALPTPAPIGGARRGPVDPSGRDLALIAGGALALGILLTFVASTIVIDLDRPRPAPTLGGLGRPSTGPGSGSTGSGSGSTGSGSTGSGSAGSGSGSGSAGTGGRGAFPTTVPIDRNGDGVVDAADGFGAVDTNGDGVIDARDAAEPVDRNGDGRIDGEDGVVYIDRNGDGIIDGRDGVAPTDVDGDGAIEADEQPPAPRDRDGDGVIDRDDVAILSDTNGDGIIDRRDVAIVEDLNGDGTIDRNDVEQATDRNGDGVVDGRDDLEVIDANGDGAVDDDELLATLDRNGDGVIDRDEALVLDGDGDGRLDRTELDALPLSGYLGGELEDRRQELDTQDLLRKALIGLGVAALFVLLVTIAVVVRRRLADRQARAERAWALVLVDRLEDEGARRGRPRRRAESVAAYAAALGAEELADPRLVEVGAVISAALFAPVPPSDHRGAWASAVIDDAVAAHPVPTRAQVRQERRERRRAERGDAREPVSTAP